MEPIIDTIIEIAQQTEVIASAVSAVAGFILGLFREKPKKKDKR